MNLIWQDIKTIVELYEKRDEELRQAYWDWQMDEDQTGVPNPFEESMEDTCRWVLSVFKRGASQ